MPKIITGIKEKIISEAANIISSGDYSAFSARQNSRTVARTWKNTPATRTFSNR